MSEDGKFWVAINAIVWLSIVIIIYLLTSYWKDHNSKIVELIGNGTDPVAVMCAMQDDYGTMPVCIVLATKKNDG